MKAVIALVIVALLAGAVAWIRADASADTARKLNAAHAQAVTKLKDGFKAELAAATGKETIRREAVIQTIQVRSQRDIAELDRLATRLAVAQEESRRASQALDAVACLPADSVRRLAAVR